MVKPTGKTLGLDHLSFFAHLASRVFPAGADCTIFESTFPHQKKGITARWCLLRVGRRWIEKSAMPLFRGQQFDVEIQLLTGQIVVGIEGDGGRFLGDDLDREGAAGLVVEVDLLTDA